jgi:hypothetical protein
MKYCEIVTSSSIDCWNTLKLSVSEDEIPPSEVDPIELEGEQSGYSCGLLNILSSMDIHYGIGFLVHRLRSWNDHQSTALSGSINNDQQSSLCSVSERSHQLDSLACLSIYPPGELEDDLNAS